MSNILRRATVSATTGGGISGGFTPEYVETDHTFVSTGDTNGIIYYHGTKYGTATWANPYTTGYMPWTGGWAEPHFSNTTFSSTQDGMPARRLDLMPGEAASVNLLSLHQSSTGSNRMTTFVFEGSNNRNTWQTIASGALTTANTWQTFPTVDTNFYSYFRLRNPNSSTVLRIGAIELYGTLRRRMNDALVFKEYLDTRDFFYLLGSRNALGVWDNPALNPTLLTASQSDTTNRVYENPASNTTTKSWIFGPNISIRPSALTVRNHTGTATGAIGSNFKIEATMDGGNNWTTLWAHQAGEAGLPKTWNLFNIDSGNSYNGFRFSYPGSARMEEAQLYGSQYDIPAYEGGANTFDAASYTNLAAWYDASDLALANNQKVTVWPDRSNNGFDLLAPDTESLQPTFSLANRSVKFSAQYLSVEDSEAPLAKNEEATVFVVGYKTNNSSSRNVIVSSRIATSGDNGICWVWEGATNSTRMRSYRPGASGKDTGSSGFLVPAGLHIWHMRVSAAQANWGHDGVVDHSFDTMGLPTATDTLFIGGEGTSTGVTNLLNAMLKEVIFYRRYLSDSEIESITAALKNKWGI